MLLGVSLPTVDVYFREFNIAWEKYKQKYYRRNIKWNAGIQQITLSSRLSIQLILIISKDNKVTQGLLTFTQQKCLCGATSQWTAYFLYSQWSLSLLGRTVCFHICLLTSQGLFNDWIYFLLPSSALRISKHSPNRQHAGMVFVTTR